MLPVNLCPRGWQGPYATTLCILTAYAMTAHTPIDNTITRLLFTSNYSDTPWNMLAVCYCYCIYQYGSYHEPGESHLGPGGPGPTACNNCTNIQTRNGESEKPLPRRNPIETYRRKSTTRIIIMTTSFATSEQKRLLHVAGNHDDDDGGGGGGGDETHHHHHDGIILSDIP